MDIREIQKMHQQYAQAPITIDMDPTNVQVLSASSGDSSPASPGSLVRSARKAVNDNVKIVGIIALVAMVSLPVGMMLASTKKRPDLAPPASAPAQSVAAASKESPAPDATERVQWPERPGVASAAAAPLPVAAQKDPRAVERAQQPSSPRETHKAAMAPRPTAPQPVKAEAAATDIKLF
ncbi:flagellar biosynthesis protein FlhF [Cupriavidus numazuensis]|uniref:Uncharacterized protein n=1 Tax=Cupriavidus numazuensis TaxID=221992 RepID=A0ABM8TTR0_9BURK|nr:hypothetical protein [Cupriavidus numazuensis]CAG2159763.1 hypothetical protein LMG26411_06959 [Cupriavidus numazuensis]